MNLPRLPVPILLRILVFNLLVLFLPVASLPLSGNLRASAAECSGACAGSAGAHACGSPGVRRDGAGERGDRDTPGLLPAVTKRASESSMPAAACWRDTSRLGPRQEKPPAESPRGEPDPDFRPEDSLLYRLSTIPFRLYRSYLKAPQPPLETAEFYSGSSILLGDEILAALQGTLRSGHQDFTGRAALGESLLCHSHTPGRGDLRGLSWSHSRPSAS